MILPHIHPILMKEILKRKSDYVVNRITEPLKKVFLEVEKEMASHILPDPEYNIISSVAAFVRLSTMSYNELVSSAYYPEIIKERCPMDNYLINEIASSILPLETAIQLYMDKPNKINLDKIIRNTEFTEEHFMKLLNFYRFTRDVIDMISCIDLSIVEKTMDIIEWNLSINQLRMNPTFTYEFACRHMNKIIIDTSNSINYAYYEGAFNEVMILQYVATYEYLKQHIDELDYYTLSYLFVTYHSNRKTYYDDLFRIICEYPEKKWYMNVITTSKYITLEMVLANPQVRWAYKELIHNINITEEMVQSHPEIQWNYTGTIQNPNIGWEIAPFSKYNTYSDYRKLKSIKITNEYILKIFQIIKL